MPLAALQHINIRCLNVERSREFYVAVLGLKEGPRPPFASTGYWLYLGDNPVVHLVQRRPDEIIPEKTAGALDHIAFAGHGLAAMRETLAASGLAFREALVPRDNTIQIFVADPDGVPLELNFERPANRQAMT